MGNLLAIPELPWARLQPRIETFLAAAHWWRIIWFTALPFKQLVAPPVCCSVAGTVHLFADLPW